MQTLAAFGSAFDLRYSTRAVHLVSSFRDHFVQTTRNEEYVWLSAHANLPMFTVQDHPALFQAGKTGQIIGTTVQAEGQMLKFIKEGVMAASILQKRKLFTYYGAKALYEIMQRSCARRA